jgi:Uma2 family endonuclease
MTLATQLLEPMTLTPTKKRTVRPEPKPVVKLLTMYDLPSENKTEEPPMDQFHQLQALLLMETFILLSYSAKQILTAMDMYLYYDPAHPYWYKRADWFAAVGVSHLYKDGQLRQSYVVWDEGVAPYIVAEFLSPGTKKEDLGNVAAKDKRPPPKWKVYEEILKIPYYLIFDEKDKESKLLIYKLDGGKYREQQITNNRLWIPELKIGIGVWHGDYRGATRSWLRWYDTTGEWLPTPVEQAELLVEQAEARTEQLATKLRELGIDPTTIA